MKIQRLLTAEEAKRRSHLRVAPAGRVWLTLAVIRRTVTAEKTFLRLKIDNPDDALRLVA
jgi:hypothetical protein